MVRRASDIAPTTAPRTLVGDTGLLSISKDPGDSTHAELVARSFVEDSKGLGVILKAPKSGADPGSRAHWKGLQRHAGSMRIPRKARARNLGRELLGPRALRVMEKEA